MQVWEEAVLCGRGCLCGQVHTHSVGSSNLSQQEICLNCPCRVTPAACTPGGGGIAAAGARPTLHGQLWSGSRSPSTSHSFATQRRRSPHRLQHLLSAAGGSSAEGTAPTDAAGELPLWRFLRQQGFSADGISRMRAATRKRSRQDGTKLNQVPGVQITEQKLQRDLAPNIAALQAEGLGTASVERLFVQFPRLLTSTHATFSSSLAALRQLALLLPDDPRAVQAPPGATQLGAALWLYPAAAQLLARVNLASLIDGNLRLRRQLGVSDAATAAAVFRHHATLVSNVEGAEAMVSHLQRLQASGELSEEQGEQRQYCLSMFALHTQS